MTALYLLRKGSKGVGEVHVYYLYRRHKAVGLLVKLSIRMCPKNCGTNKKKLFRKLKLFFTHDFFILHYNLQKALVLRAMGRNHNTDYFSVSL